jgi:predicted HTH transcriptional regulator
MNDFTYHADYEQRGASIRLAIFDDRIEIENPGLLRFGLTIDDIKRGVSKLRNRVIGRVFHKLGLIERWGSGIKRIIENCNAAGFSEPVFEELGTNFRVTIFTVQTEQPRLDEIDQQILEALKHSAGCTTETVANAIKRSKRATRSCMLTLIDKGLVIEIGLSPKDPHKKYFLLQEKYDSRLS